MRYRWSKAVVALVAIVAALAAAQGAAAQAEVFHFTDEFATAGFRSTDPTGCITTNVLVTGGDDVNIEPPGAPERTSGASLRVQEFNRCTGEFTICSGSTDEALFNSNPSVKNATLVATVPLTCQTSEGTTVTKTGEINLTWTCTGEVDRFRRDSHFNFEGFRQNAFFRGSACDAVATGTVLVDGVNVTPNPSRSAEIVSETGHQVVIVTVEG